MSGHRSRYRDDILAIAARYDDAIAMVPPRRSEAVGQLVSLARRVHAEVALLHFKQKARHVDPLADRPQYLSSGGLHRMLEDTWGIKLLSSADTRHAGDGDAPDDLDLAICQSLIEVYIDVISVMPNYPLATQAYEALDVVSHHPIGELAVGELAGAYGIEALDPFIRTPIKDHSERFGLDDLIDAIFRQFDNFSDQSYWSAFVRLSLTHFGLDSGRDGWIIPAAVESLTNSVLPFQGAMEAPEVVGVAYQATPDFYELRDALLDIQRRFMRALILAIDPSMSNREVTLQQLQRRGLPEEHAIDPDLW